LNSEWKSLSSSHELYYTAHSVILYEEFSVSESITHTALLAFFNRMSIIIQAPSISGKICVRKKIETAQGKKHKPKIT
jgi:hypothetical protein